MKRVVNGSKGECREGENSKAQILQFGVREWRRREMRRKDENMSRRRDCVSRRCIAESVRQSESRKSNLVAMHFVIKLFVGYPMQLLLLLLLQRSCRHGKVLSPLFHLASISLAGQVSQFFLLPVLQIGCSVLYSSLLPSKETFICVFADCSPPLFSEL